MTNETTNKTRNKLTSPRGKGKFRNLLSSKRSAAWNRKSLERFCSDHGHQIIHNYNYASENKIGGVYWVNTTLHWLNQGWDIILNDAHNRCFNIFHIPANSFMVSNFVIKSNRNGRKINLVIDKQSFV